MRSVEQLKAEYEGCRTEQVTLTVGGDRYLVTRHFSGAPASAGKGSVGAEEGCRESSPENHVGRKAEGSSERSPCERTARSLRERILRLAIARADREFGLR